MKLFLYIHLFFFLVQNTYSNTIIEWNDSSSKLELIGKKTSTYIDHNNNLDIKDILEKKSQFQKSDRKFLVPFSTLSKKSIWINFDLNMNSSIKQSLLLEFGYSWLDLIEVYTVLNKKIIKKQTLGDQRPFNERNYQHRHFIFNLDLESNKNYEIFIKIKSQEFMLIPISLWNKQSFESYSYFMELLFGISFGVILVMIFYNLIIYLMSRDKIYLLYTFYSLAVLFFIVVFTGTGFTYLWGENIEFHNISIPLAGSLMFIALNIFLKSFLQIKEQNKKLNQLCNLNLYYNYICLFLTFFIDPQITIFLIYNISGFVLTALLIYISIRLYRDGFKPAQFVLVAFSGLIFITPLYTILVILKVLDYNMLTLHILPIAFALEITLFAFALAYKIKIIKEEQLKAKEEANNQLKEQVFYLDKINKSTSTVCSINEMKDMCSFAVNELRSILDSNVVSFYIYNEKEDLFDFFVYSGPKDLSFQEKLDERSIILNEVKKKKSYYISNNLKEDENYISFSDNTGNKYISNKLLTVPVIDNEELLGVINFTKNELKEDFDESQINIAQTLATSMSISYKNILLLQETEIKAKLEKELETSSLVQQSFFPREIPKTPSFSIGHYFKSADACGGDWWNVMQLNDQLIVCIGDVTGHGIPSALVTAVAYSYYSTMQYLIEEKKLSIFDPVDLLQRLNKVIYNSCGKNYLMTFHISVINEKDKTITYASAGHTFPYIFNQSNPKKVESLNAEGHPLGFKENWEGKVEKYSYNKNDTIMWYTDGITECKNSQNQMIKERTILKVIKSNLEDENPQNICDLVIKQVDKFREDTPLDDDLTLLIGKLA